MELTSLPSSVQRIMWALHALPAAGATYRGLVALTGLDLRSLRRNLSMGEQLGVFERAMWRKRRVVRLSPDTDAILSKLLQFRKVPHARQHFAA